MKKWLLLFMTFTLLVSISPTVYGKQSNTSKCTIAANTVVKSKGKVNQNEVPVLLIHGYNDTGESWLESDYVKELKKENRPYAIIDYGKCSRNDVTSNEIQNIIKKAIDDALAKYSVQSVDIVAHSMGGLATRWFLLQNQTYNAKVRKVVMVGTPNHGARVPFLTRLSTIISDAETYATEEDIKKYKNLIIAYNLNTVTSIRPQSYTSWLEQSGYYSGLENLQYVAAGTDNQLFNGEVGSPVLDGGVRYRYSLANLHYGLLLSESPLTITSTLKKLKMFIVKTVNKNREEDSKAPTTKYNGAGAELIVQDRLNLQHFNIQGKEQSYTYVANLWLENMEREEKRMRNAYFNAGKHMPTYRTVSSTELNNIDTEIEYQSVWDNTFGQLLEINELEARLGRKIVSSDTLGYIPTLKMEYNVENMAIDFAELGDGSYWKDEDSDMVVGQSSVYLKDQYLFDSGKHFDDNKVNHTQQVNNPEMYRDLVNYGIDKNESEATVSLQDIFEQQFVYTNEQPYIILKRDGLLASNNETVQVNIYANKNAEIYYFKRNAEEMYNEFYKVRYTASSTREDYALKATYYLKPDETIEDYLFYSSNGQSGLGKDFLVEIIPNSDEQFEQPTNKTINHKKDDQIISDYTIEYIEGSLNQKDGKRSFDFIVKNASNKFSNEFINLEDFTLYSSGILNNDFNVKVKEKAKKKKNTEIVLALDYSSSMSGEAIDVSRATASKFINTLTNEYIQVMGFHNDVFTIHPFSTNYEIAGQTLFQYDTDGDTSLIDAIYDGATSFSETVDNRVLIVMTDGEDNDSIQTALTAKEEIEKNNVQLFIVSVNSSINANMQELLMSENIQLIETSNFNSLDIIYGNLAETSEYIYTISYDEKDFARKHRKTILSLDEYSLVSKFYYYMFDQAPVRKNTDTLQLKKKSSNIISITE